MGWKVGRWGDKWLRGVRTATALCAAGWVRPRATGLGLARSGCFAVMDAEALTLQSRGQWHGIGATLPRDWCHAPPKGFVSTERETGQSRVLPRRIRSHGVHGHAAYG